jgi:PKD repeat protein
VVHAYDAAGVYNVTLVAANSDCNNTTQKTITVGNTTTGIENTNAGSLNILGQGNHIVLEFSNLGADKANLTVFNMLGQQVDSFTGISTVNGRAELSLTNVVSGYYLVRVLTGNKVYNQKLLLGSN